MPNAAFSFAQFAFNKTRKIKWSVPLCTSLSYLSADCPVRSSSTLGGKRLDLAKATDDLLLRLATMAPMLLKKSGGRNAPRFAAVCGAMGALLAGWQQLLESSMVENSTGVLAHAALIERISNLHKYFLFPYSDVGEEARQDEKAYEQKRKVIKAFAKSKALANKLGS